ncbi:MAG: hypothetical protein PVI54_09790 [Desulfobacteraceae bacterium]|jgi:hypothetical protein
MKDQSQIETAWQIWHLISRLNDLIWTHYEKEFLDLVKKNDPFKPGNQIDDRPF